MSRALVDVLKRDPHTGDRLLKQQFVGLVGPLMLRMIDERDNQDEVIHMLSVISESQHSPFLPVKFPITGQPAK